MNLIIIVKKYQLIYICSLLRYKHILTLLVNKGVGLAAFTPKETEALVPDFPILPTFLHLPKVHKGTSPVQGRPIVSGIGSLNEHLGEWVDGQLCPVFSEILTIYWRLWTSLNGAMSLPS